MASDEPGSLVACCSANPRPAAVAPAGRRVRPRGVGASGDADRREHPPRPVARTRRGARRSCSLEDRCRSRNSSTTSRGAAVRRHDAAGSPLRAARAAQEPGVLAGGDRDARHRHRRRHRGLQHRRRGPAAAAALSRSRAPGPRVRNQPAEELDAQHRVAGELRRLEDAEHGLHRHRRLRAVQLQRQRRQRDLPDRPRRAAGAEVAGRHRQPVQRPRRAAAARAARSPTRKRSRARRASRS